MASEQDSTEVTLQSTEEPEEIPNDDLGSLNNEKDDYICQLCHDKFKEPKVLNCLHVFCLECLEKQIADLEEEKNGEARKQSPSCTTSLLQAIVCMTCKHETRLSTKGLEGLQTENVMSALLDMSSIEDLQIVCTSCKAKEKATARCNDCASFLCPNCVTAHQFMRCFENHKVVSFEDLKKGDGVIHKPLFCPVHSTESMKCYCSTCQVPICGECMLTDHRAPDHHCEKISDVDKKSIEDIQHLITEARSKISGLSEAETNLTSALSNLEMQRDDAKGLILETFQSYKAILERKKDDLLREMQDQYSKQRVGFMEAYHNVMTSTEKMEDACKFSERILAHGEPLHVMMLRKIITKQLMYLINNLPKHDISCNIEFKTDAQLFEETVNRNFGYLVKDDKDDSKTQSIPSSSPERVTTHPWQCSDLYLLSA